MNAFNDNLKELEEIIIPTDSPWPTRLAMIIFALIIGICVTQGQVNTGRPIPGGGVNLIASGCGHGSFYGPYLSVGLGDNTLLLNGLFQTQTSDFAGVRLAYTRNLSSSVYDKWEIGERGYDIVQLNVYSYLQYFHDCQVSEAVQRFEQLKRGDQAANIRGTTYKTAQAGGGIEFRFNLSKNISLRNCIGLSVYHHLDNKELLFHEQTALSLGVSTGIHFVIN